MCYQVKSGVLDCNGSEMLCVIRCNQVYWIAMAVKCCVLSGVIRSVGLQWQ